MINLEHQEKKIIITRIMHNFNKNIFHHLISVYTGLTNLVNERTMVAKYLTVSQVVTEDKLEGMCFR